MARFDRTALALCLVATGCGARTGDLDSSGAFGNGDVFPGSGSISGSGAESGNGGAAQGSGAAGATSSGGFGGVAGGPVGGYVGYGGYAGGPAGGAIGYGGYVGYGGYAGGPLCDPGFCGSMVTSTPYGPMEYPGCCTPYGSCGLRTDVVSKFVPFTPSCIEPSGPGIPDGSCPGMASPNGLPVPGCCRSDGLCGYDLSLLGLGCEMDPGLDYVQSCSPYGTGGYPGMGGYSGGGAYPGTGGYYYPPPPPATGGYGGMSAGAAQCVSQARSECETCACTSCFDGMTACFADPGCPEILACANQTGCTGFGCMDPSTCEAVINQYGGVGSPSVALAIPLFSCLQSAGCPCGFGK